MECPACCTRLDQEEVHVAIMMIHCCVVFSIVVLVFCCVYMDFFKGYHIFVQLVCPLLQVI